MGTYEKEKQKLFAENVKPGDVVYDIGAHVGFYTLVASKLVGENGFVYAFEPLPGNVGFIMKHVRMNKCKNTFVVEKAVTDNSGMVHFKYGDSSSTGEINTYGKGIEVEAMSIDDFSITNRPPAVMKIDVEGEEAKVLTGAEKILAENSPVIFLAIHGENRRVECVKILKSAGYKITEIVEGELFAVKGGDSQKEHPKL
ncbi:MAG: Methyltransferase, FkbM family [Candidatus Jorgensenbacteria bacterium GW2011_GWA2_45_9]|uniref:Methyltransferase, FkbM family n=1 Tax=Candidatus Jorgensenbacteria bacterium GW2011_GWA2_45_9 TaxID=1618663 RepID=A0A0G1Q9F7_9BACT|nr:MAG: Methyltransferase, FkbM family [Candidatus Jorgensenbacteria bacterium GW2011_GWA2_45_9]